MTGKVGVGKSTLVNALVGMDVAKTGTAVGSVTRKVERKVVNKNGIYVDITDTPGLGDLDMNNDDTLHKAREYNEDIDLLLFCIKMNDVVSNYDRQEIEAITKSFGIYIWNKGVFVLTFANEISETDFISKLDEKKTSIRKIIAGSVDPRVVENIPIVPTGFKEPQLPDRPSWISELWIQVFRRIPYKAKVYLAQLNHDRIHKSTDKIKLSQPLYGDPETLPLVICQMSKDERWIDPEYIRKLSPYFGALVGAGVCAKYSDFTSQNFMETAYAIMQAAKIGADFANWTTNLMLENFEQSVKEVQVHCYDEVIMHSLIYAFIYEDLRVS